MFCGTFSQNNTVELLAEVTYWFLVKQQSASVVKSNLHRCWSYPVLYSLTEIETETEMEMFCKTETKYKRESEHMKRNSN